MADVLKTHEAAARLRVESKKVRKMIATGELPAMRSGRVIRISSDAIDRLLGGGAVKADHGEDGQ